MRRVLVTGSRDLETSQPVDEALWAQARLVGDLGKLTVVHGDCPTGADYFARQFCTRHPEVTEERYPALWGKYGKAAGMIRNGTMCNLGADVCLAFVRPGSKGTVDCVQRAKVAGIPVIHG